ncbi:hypothetical protein GWI33_003066 [Rhynchophorus ferrugineus]|uniref:BPL/LPL catalytic domain-containing protein n=1 Tax=Rhynchophorus ferrugineus TaxID=354439 RepID=A0A834MKY0_RHYFE|nr:hypothetical protein GWI33_003066 [Rhynchophorus ferrugineus]
MRLAIKSVKAFRTGYRCYSSVPETFSKSIYVSKETDIFTNLALEDWFYSNLDFTNEEVLMLWQNKPCVVIGRHQNPWIECNFAMLPYIAGGTKLARRNSGGGTVYHDLGNLNLTFFTNRKAYNRKRNLELISRSLKSSFKINSEITPREDLCIGNMKISGTASKLGRNSAYHHCTLLVNTNKNDLSLALKNSLEECVDIKTNASRSVKSPIINLKEENKDIQVKEVMAALIQDYKKTTKTFKDFKIIEDINEQLFPGITYIRNQYCSVAWIYEKTPKFQLWKNIPLLDDEYSVVKLSLSVDNGKVTNVELNIKDRTLSESDIGLKDFYLLINNLVGKPFSQELLDEFELVASGLKNSQLCRDIVHNNVL